jgi:hypothetical protein
MFISAADYTDDTESFAVETCPTHAIWRPLREADLSAAGGKDSRIDFSSGTPLVWVEFIRRSFGGLGGVKDEKFNR